MPKSQSLLIACLVLVGCAKQRPAPAVSPDGSMTLHTSVEQSRKDRGAYLCVIFEIRDGAGRVLHSENTRASAQSKWTMTWVKNDRVRLDSSDIGTHYWQRQADGKWRKEGG